MSKWWNVGENFDRIMLQSTVFSCTNVGNSFQCQCVSGFQGVMCETATTSESICRVTFYLLKNDVQVVV